MKTYEKYQKHIDECGMYYYICDGEEIIAEAFYGDDAQDIVDLLNSLSEENEQLKEKNKRLDAECEKLFELCEANGIAVF